MKNVYNFILGGGIVLVVIPFLISSIFKDFVAPGVGLVYGMFVLPVAFVAILIGFIGSIGLFRKKINEQSDSPKVSKKIVSSVIRLVELFFLAIIICIVFLFALNIIGIF